MPTYDYECTECKHQFEERKSFSEDGKTTQCPQCDGQAARVFTAVPVIFKGSGFYVTDHRKGGASGGSAPETPAASS